MQRNTSDYVKVESQTFIKVITYKDGDVTCVTLIYVKSAFKLLYVLAKKLKKKKNNSEKLKKN
jgi:hypothetical protein